MRFSQFKTHIMEDDVDDIKKISDVGLPHDLIIDTHFAPTWDHHTDFTSLEGSPEEVPGDVDISVQKKLKSLAHSPQKVGGRFMADHSGILSLHGGPVEVGGDYDVSYTPITSLEGSPKHVGGNYNCSYIKGLKNVVGASERIDGDFICETATIKLAPGGPKFVGGSVRLQKVAGNSLSGIDKCFPEVHGTLYINGNVDVTNVLGVFNIVGLHKVFFAGNFDLADLVNKYLPEGKKGGMRAQMEMMKKGWVAQAKL